MAHNGAWWRVIHLTSLLVFALSDPGFTTRLMSPPSQSKSIQLRIDSVRPIPVVAISIRCVRISALPCPVSCAQRSAMSHRVASCPIVALPCQSISDRFLSTPILSAAPPFASDPISAMTCLLAADLFRGCSARRDSLPCHSAASQCTSIPSHRCFAVSLMVGSKLCYSAASPVRAVLLLAIAYPIYTVHFPCCSSEFNARSSLLVSYRVASPPFRSYSYRRLTIPQPFASSRVHSLPSPVLSGRCHAIACHLISVCTVHGHSLARRIGSVLGCAVSYLLDVMLFRIKSSPLQSAPSRFSASLFSAKQGGSNPLPLVSWRLQLFSALPYQILESRLQALPWLLFAFPCRAIPHPFGSLRLRWPRFQICSFRLLSQPLRSSAMPIWANRFSAAPSHIVSPRLDSVSCQIRFRPSISKPCPCDSNKAGLITSVAFRVLSMRIRSRQSPGRSAPPAPISAVLDLLYAHQLSSTQIHIWTLRLFSSPCFSSSSQIRSRPRRSCSPPVRATRIHCLS